MNSSKIKNRSGSQHEKTMDKEKFQKAELTPDEQKEFKGGMLCADFQPGEGDIVNKNWRFACECRYTNKSVIYNMNEVDQCRCTCTF